MSLFLKKVKSESRFSLTSDPLYSRCWEEIGKPLMSQGSSNGAGSEQEQRSKELLAQTLKRCKKFLPKTKRYTVGDPHDFDYMKTLKRLCDALAAEHWCDACGITCKIVKYYCANDVRTMYTIIGILEEFV